MFGQEHCNLGFLSNRWHVVIDERLSFFPFPYEERTERPHHLFLRWHCEHFPKMFFSILNKRQACEALVEPRRHPTLYFFCVLYAVAGLQSASIGVSIRFTLRICVRLKKLCLARTEWFMRPTFPDFMVALFFFRTAFALARFHRRNYIMQIRNEEQRAFYAVLALGGANDQARVD